MTSKLPSADTILQQAVLYNENSGIYVLVEHPNTIQYVGQSRQVPVRISTHKTENRIPFDKYFFIAMKGSMHREDFESRLIEALNPPYNKSKTHFHKRRSAATLAVMSRDD